jgi:2-dehydropantoate 2-reductase
MLHPSLALRAGVQRATPQAAKIARTPFVNAVCIVGAGGIGCAVGYALCSGGVNPLFVDANPAKVRWGRDHGVRLDRRPALPAAFQHFDDWTPVPGSTVLLCTKCYDNAAVLARLPEDIILIPIQNGFDPAIGPDREALEGIASFVSECYPQQAHTRITRKGRLHLGSRCQSGQHASPGADAQELIALLRRYAPFRVEVVPNSLPYKYTKLMYNAAISPLAAAAGLHNGQLLSLPVARRLFFGLLRENYAILRGAGIGLGKIGPFHPDTVQWILQRVRVAGFLAWCFYPSLRGTYCSMSGDLPRGQTEIEYYNGHLIGLAGDRPCPLNRQVYDLVKRMERDRVPPALQMLDELLESPAACRTG